MSIKYPENKKMKQAAVTDDELVEMLKSPDSKDKAFRLLMRKYGSRLYWHVRRIVVSHEDAEDVMQETAINILAGIEKFKKKS